MTSGSLFIQTWMIHIWHGREEEIIAVSCLFKMIKYDIVNHIVTHQTPHQRNRQTHTPLKDASDH